MVAVNIIVLYFVISIADLLNRKKTAVKRKLSVSVVLSLVYTFGIISNINLFLNNNYIFIIILTLFYCLPCGIMDVIKNYIIINILGCITFGFMNYMLSIFDCLKISIVIISMLMVYCAIKLLILYMKYHKYYKLSIFCNNETVRLKALLDSGNLLIDTVTGKPVIIAEQSALGSIINNVDFRILPYKTLGNENGYFHVFKADKAFINNYCITHPIIAIYNTRLSDNGEYNAIIGLKHLGGK